MMFMKKKNDQVMTKTDYRKSSIGQIYLHKVEDLKIMILAVEWKVSPE